MVYAPPIMRTYFLATRPLSVMVVRSCRLRLPVLGLFKCFLPLCFRLSLPVADTLERVRMLLCVFILGMVVTVPSVRGLRQEKVRRAEQKRKGPWRSPGGPVEDHGAGYPGIGLILYRKHGDMARRNSRN